MKTYMYKPIQIQEPIKFKENVYTKEIKILKTITAREHCICVKSRMFQFLSWGLTCWISEFKNTKNPLIDQLLDVFG